ncbi:unnamed protein product, partial [Mycena citricolor]
PSFWIIVAVLPWCHCSRASSGLRRDLSPRLAAMTPLISLSYRSDHVKRCLNTLGDVRKRRTNNLPTRFSDGVGSLPTSNAFDEAGGRPPTADTSTIQYVLAACATYLPRCL